MPSIQLYLYISYIFINSTIKEMKKQSMFDVLQEIRKRQEDQAALEWIMKRQIRTIMELPTEDQIYDNISFKLGAFYKRFWENQTQGLQQSTRKAGEIIAFASKMKSITRQQDRLIKVCAYAREVRKFQSERYQQYKKFIWMDLSEEERKQMEIYVDQMTPPVPYKNELKEAYQQREKATMFYAYKKMKRAMLMLEVFELIWRIQKQKVVETFAKETLAQINKTDKQIRGYFAAKMGLQEWKIIEKLW